MVRPRPTMMVTVDDKFLLSALDRLYRATFDWKVTSELAAAANRFVQAFNALVPGALPAVVPENAALFYDEHKPWATTTGRCVRIGFDPGPPARHYHWAICEANRSELKVQEFWSKRAVDDRAVHS